MSTAEAPQPVESRKEQNKNAVPEKTGGSGLTQQFGDLLAESFSNRDLTSALVRGDFVQAGVAASADPEIRNMLGGLVLDVYGQIQNAASIAEKSEGSKRLNERAKLGPDSTDRPTDIPYGDRSRTGAIESAKPSPLEPAPPKENALKQESKEVVPSAPPPAAPPPDNNHVATFPDSYARLAKADPTKGDELTKKDLDTLLADPKTTAADAALARLFSEHYKHNSAFDGDPSSISETDLNEMLKKHPAEALNAGINEQLKEIRKREQLGLPRNASEAEIKEAAEERGLSDTIAEMEKLLEEDPEDLSDQLYGAIERAVDKGIPAEIVVKAFEEIGDVTDEYDRATDTYSVYIPLMGRGNTVEFTVGSDGKLVRK